MGDFNEEAFPKFDALAPDRKRALIENMAPEKRMPFMQAVKAWKTKQPSPTLQKAVDLYQQPQPAPMSVGQPAAPSTQVFKGEDGRTVEAFGHKWQLTSADAPLWHSALVIPAALDAADDIHTNLIAPALRKGQTALRQELGYENPDGTPNEQRWRENTAAGRSAVTQYLGAAAFQWVLGEKFFEDMPENLKLQAINEFTEISRHPLFLKADDRMAGALLREKFGMSVPDVVEAGIPALAQEGGKAPLFFIGEGKALRAIAEKAPVMGSALVGGVMGMGSSLLDPNLKPSEGLKGGAVVGGGVGAGVKAVTAGVQRAVVASGFANRFLKSVADTFAEKHLASNFDEALASVGKSLAADVEVANAVAPGETLSKMTKPVEVAWRDNFRASAVLVDNNEALAVRLYKNKPSEVHRFKLDDKKKLSQLADEGASFEFIGNALEPMNPDAEALLFKGGVTDAVTNEVGTRADRIARPGKGPLVVQTDEAGKVDLYRLSSARARYESMKGRGVPLVEGRNSSGVVSFTMPNGQRRRGWVMGKAENGNFIVSPGHEADKLPGFVDQVVEIDPVQSRVRELPDNEMKKLAQFEPENVRQFRERMPANIRNFQEMQGAFNKYVDELKGDDLNRLRPVLDPPKPMEQLLTDWSNRTGPYHQQVENAVQRVKMMFGTTREQATTLLQIAALRRQAARDPKAAKTLAAKAQKLSEWGDVLFKSDTPARLPAVKRNIPEVLPRPAGEPTYTPGKPFTPEEAAGRQLTGQSPNPNPLEAGDKLLLNDGQQVTVMHYEKGGAAVSETYGTITVRDSKGKVFSVKGTDVAGPVTGGEPVYYTPQDSKLSDDLAWVMRNMEGDERQWNVGSVVAQARKDGMTEAQIARMAHDATVAAADAERMLAPPSWQGAGGSGGQPPRPPPAPPPPGTPPPNNGATVANLQNQPVVLAAVRDKSFMERAGTLLHGPRFTAPKDLAQYINEVYGSRAMEKAKAEIVNAMSRVTGEKPLSVFRQDYLKLAEGAMSRAEFETRHAAILNQPAARQLTGNALLQRDISEQKLIALGAIPERMTDEELVQYVAHTYARFSLEPGQWADMVRKERSLYDRAVAYFKKLNNGDESKAVETVEGIIGGRDALDAQQGRARGAEKASSSLKGRSLDELERQALLGKGSLGPEGVQLIRELLGAEKDGFAAVGMTIARQQQNIANLTMWREVVGTKPDMFSRTLTREMAEQGWMQIPAVRSKYGDASGMWAHPDLYDALITQPDRQATANKLLSAISNWVKGNRTSLGPTTTANANFFGNVVYAMLAGADPLSGTMPHFGRAVRDMWTARKDPFGEAGKRLATARIRGVDVAGFGETEFASHQNQMLAEMQKRMGLENTMSIWQHTVQAVSWARGKAAALYDLNDRVWKLASYYSLLEKGGLKADGSIDYKRANRFLVGNERIEKARMARPPFDKDGAMLPPIADADLRTLIEKEAALRITSSFPDPAKVSYAVDTLRKNAGVVAPFLTYKVEDARVWMSVPMRIKRGERDLLYRGLGYMGIMAGVGYGSTQLARWNGISEADEKAARANLMQTSRGFRPFMVTIPWRDSDGRVQFLDMTPYVGWGSYLQGVDVDKSGMDNATRIMTNVVKAPVDGSSHQAWVDEFMARAGIGEERYMAQLREDQKGWSQALGYASRNLGLIPQGGPQQGLDIWNAMNTSGPTAEPLTGGQAAMAAAGFRNLPSGKGTYIKAAQGLQGAARGTVADQKKAVMKIPTQQSRTLPEAVADMFDKRTTQEKVRDAVLVDSEKRKKELEKLRDLAVKQRKAK